MFYECTLIASPSLTKEQLDTVQSQMQSVIQAHQGKVLNTEYWGFKTLTYPIQKGSKAHYLHIGFSIDQLKPIYDHLKFHQSILRYLIVKYPKGLTYPTYQIQSSHSAAESSEAESAETESNNYATGESS